MPDPRHYPDSATADNREHSENTEPKPADNWRSIGDLVRKIVGEKSP